MKIQEILERIEKLKDGLQKKNELLAEREHRLQELAHKSEEQARLIAQHEETIRKLQRRMNEESSGHSEAFNLASQVEALTRAQKEAFELRQRVRKLENQLKHGGGPSAEQQSAFAGEEMDELMQVITIQQEQIQGLEERLAKAGMGSRGGVEAVPGLEAGESAAAAILTALREEMRQALAVSSDDLPSMESKDELPDFLQACRAKIDRLREELRDSAGKDDVILILQEQVDEADAKIEAARAESASLRAEIENLREIINEKDEIIAEQQVQISEFQPE